MTPGSVEAVSFFANGRLIITQDKASLRFELTTPRLADSLLKSAVVSHPLCTLEVDLPSGTTSPLVGLLTSPNSLRLSGSLPPEVQRMLTGFCGWFSEHFGGITPDSLTQVVRLSLGSSPTPSSPSTGK